MFMQKMKLFRILADFKSTDNLKKHKYFVAAEDMEEALLKFRRSMSGFKVYELIECDKNFEESVLKDPRNYIIF